MKRFFSLCLALTLVAPLTLGCDNSPAAKKADADKKAVDAHGDAMKANVDADAKATKDNIDAGVKNTDEDIKNEKKAEEAGAR